MASSSVSHSESHSDTYIPEYSQTPILNEIAQHARAMSDYVYNWGIDRFNKNQGDIDGLMRDALTYASPARIAVDMGMAEAGVQQAAERGRLSAIKDLESYGIDPSSGRYAALDMSNRVMSAAAAAGAGNQQRMADYAAGNAMRNQAMAAGLQNSQFGLGVGGLANQYLQTASSLKYPPLGRYSDSVSDSSSGSSDGGGGGSKPAKDEKPPPQQQEKAAPAPQQPGAGKPTKPADQPDKVKPEPVKPQPEQPKEQPKGPDDPNRVPKPEEYEDKMPPIPDPAQPDFSDLNPPFDESQMPPIPDPAQPDFSDIQPPLQDPDLEGMTPQQTPLPQEDTPPDTQPGGAAETPSGMDMEFDPWKDVPNAQEGDGDQRIADYDPYAENIQTAAFEDNQGQIDPVTGEPIDQVTDAEGTQDMAGSLYGMEGGDWTFEGDQPTAADWGDAGTDQAGTYDATYDTWGDEAPVTDAEESPGGGDWSFEDYTDTEGQFEDTGDYGETPTDYNQDYGDYGDEGDYDYGDDYSEDDYDTTDDYADEDYADDYADEDYADDYEDDAGDDSYEDYTDEDYEDTGDDDYEDTSDDSWSDDSDDSWSDDSGGDDGGDYARGGPVRKRRRRMATGFRPRPRRMARGGRVPGQPGQMPGLQRPGQMPGMQRPNPRVGQRMDPPPRPPQAPRPARGAPMPARGGPRPAPMRTGMNAMPPGNMLSANGMPPPTMGGMPRPQRMAQGGPARGPNPQHATSGGFVSRELSPSGGSKVDDVDAKLNAEEFVIPKDVAMWKGKEFFYKMIAQARKMRSGGDQNSPSPQNNSPRPQNNSPRPRTGYGAQR